MADSKEKLFSDFPSVSTQEWMDKITVDLKGADFEKKLVWKTNEGFKVKPFYRKDNTWFVRQDINVTDPAEANKKALDLLNKGIDSLGFKVKATDLSAEYIATLLKDICCDCIELNFSTCQGHTVELAELLVAYFKEKGYDPKSLQGSVNFDPISKMLGKGKDKSMLIEKAKKLIETLAEFPKFRCIAVNCVDLNNSGAYIYQELGYALSWGNEYLNQMVEAGVPAALSTSVSAQTISWKSPNSVPLVCFGLTS